MAAANTATRLLDTAQLLIQQRGYNAFSYKDLAEAVGIRTASIHYHFPSKAALGVALIDRYVGHLEQTLAQIDGSAAPARTKLERFIDLYRATESGGGLCLCGSLASDVGTLDPALAGGVRRYLRLSREWVEATIHEGVRSGDFRAASTGPATVAAALVAGLQGGLVVAQAAADGPVLDAIQSCFFEQLKP